MPSVTSGRGRSQGGVFGGNCHSYKDFLFQGARRKRNLHQGERTIFLESPLVILSTAPPTDSLPHLLNHLLNHPLTYSQTHTHSIPDLLYHSITLTHLLPNSLTNSFIPSFTHSPTYHTLTHRSLI